MAPANHNTNSKEKRLAANLRRRHLVSRIQARVMDRPTSRRIFKTCIGFIVLAVFIWIYTVLDLGHALETEWLDERIRSQGRVGWLLFVLLAATMTAVAGPRQLVSFAGGYLYSAPLGITLAIAGALLGCMVDFFLARFFMHSWVKRRMGKQMRRINSYLERAPFLMTIIIRLLPVGNNTATSLAAGLSSISALPFLAGSAIGYLPQTIIFTLLGSGLQMEQTGYIAVSVLLFAVSIGLGIYLFRRLRFRL